MNEYTKEPWRNEEQSVYGEGDSYIGYLEDFSDEDARRIVACVNACQDINIDVLERPAHLGKTIQEYFEKRLEMQSEITTLKAQRDELLTALTQAARDFIDQNGAWPKWWTKSIAIMAKEAKQ